jgi:hypothetical protein
MRLDSAATGASYLAESNYPESLSDHKGKRIIRDTYIQKCFLQDFRTDKSDCCSLGAWMHVYSCKCSFYNTSFYLLYFRTKFIADVRIRSPNDQMEGTAASISCHYEPFASGTVSWTLRTLAGQSLSLGACPNIGVCSMPYGYGPKAFLFSPLVWVV